MSLEGELDALLVVGVGGVQPTVPVGPESSAQRPLWLRVPSHSPSARQKASVARMSRTNMIGRGEPRWRGR